MTTNPFGKLKIEYDDDENTGTEKKVESHNPLFVEQEQKKKKKVRPEEKKKLEEERLKQQQEETEGNF
jgi:hypothetical protein